MAGIFSQSSKRMPTFSLMRRLSMRDGFSRITVVNMALGTYSGRWSKVRMRVRRQPICSTVPSMLRSGERTHSPTLNGLSIYTMAPPKKLASRSLAANATAMPPRPPNASTPEML